MHRLLLAAALALAVATAGAALVAGPSASAARGKPVAAQPAGPLALAAAYVGISTDQLRTEVRAGKSLAQIAVAHGKSRAGLVGALVAPAKQRLDGLLAAKKLTAARHARLLALATKGVERLVDAKPKPKVAAPSGHGALLEAATTYLGLDRAALVQKLRGGSSLAEIAVSQGKTRAGLKAALLDAVKAKLDALPRLTAAQKAAALAKAGEAIERVLDLKLTN